MKYLILIILIAFISCSKSGDTINQEQANCAQCYSIRQYWSDTTANRIERNKPDTTFSANLCDQKLIDFKKANSGAWGMFRDTNGHFLYWILYINKTE